MGDSWLWAWVHAGMFTASSMRMTGQGKFEANRRNPP